METRELAVPSKVETGYEHNVILATRTTTTILPAISVTATRFKPDRTHTSTSSILCLSPPVSSAFIHRFGPTAGCNNELLRYTDSSTSCYYSPSAFRGNHSVRILQAIANCTRSSGSRSLTGSDVRIVSWKCQFKRVYQLRLVQGHSGGLISA